MEIKKSRWERLREKVEDIVTRAVAKVKRIKKIERKIVKGEKWYD